MRRRLTASDPEPPEGTEVIDALGQRWYREDSSYGDPIWRRPVGGTEEAETWNKVAGNYGPVRVVAVPPDDA